MKNVSLMQTRSYSIFKFICGKICKAGDMLENITSENCCVTENEKFGLCFFSVKSLTHVVFVEEGSRAQFFI